ncbi:MAG: hypothetical protein E7559_07985 [Ruminococcaceae bacterium]|nr:hypothetical protein [Oscillospiraceae bacterium]
MRKRTAFVSLCLFLITAVLVYFPLSAAAEQPAPAVVSAGEVREGISLSSEDGFGYDEFGYDEFGDFYAGEDDFGSLSADDYDSYDDYDYDYDGYDDYDPMYPFDDSSADDYADSRPVSKGKSLTLSGIAGSIVSFFYSLFTRSSYKNSGAGRTYSLDANTRLMLGTSRDLKIDSRVSVDRNFYAQG